MQEILLDTYTIALPIILGYVDGKWYYRCDKVTYNGKQYECTVPEGQVCVWSPEAYLTYWKEITEGTEQEE